MLLWICVEFSQWVQHESGRSFFFVVFVNYVRNIYVKKAKEKSRFFLSLIPAALLYI